MAHDPDVLRGVADEIEKRITGLMCGAEDLTAPEIFVFAQFMMDNREPIIAALRSPQGDGAEAMRGMVVQAGQLQDHIDDLEEALYRIQQWSDAYPLTVFPEPDLKKARALLEAGGVTLDSISAYCMRHVVSGVGKIARAALTPDPKDAGGTARGEDHGA